MSVNGCEVYNEVGNIWKDGHIYKYIYIFIVTNLLRALLSNGSVKEPQEKDCFLGGPRRDFRYATQRKATSASVVDTQQ
jgi:hypothetical protein